MLNTEPDTAHGWMESCTKILIARSGLANLTAPCSIPEDGNYFKRKRGYIAHTLSLSLFYHPDITEILLKRT